MTPEAYSYYFKVRTFGSVDVSKLASIAMGMARETSGCFIRASNFGEMQKSVFYVGPWSLALATCSLLATVYREFRKRNPCMYFCSTSG